MHHILYSLTRDRHSLVFLPFKQLSWDFDRKMPSFLSHYLNYLTTEQNLLFMLDATHYLTRFIEQVTRMNGGRAFFTTNQSLGDYLLVDFVDHRRALRTTR